MMAFDAFKLFALNKGRGSPLSFVAQEETGILEVEVYDTIVTSDDDARYFGGVSSQAFARQLREFKGEKVHIRVNSPGGDVFGGVAMAAAINESQAEVTAFVDGYAASAAVHILTASDKVIAHPDSFVMIHKTWTIAIGNEDSMAATADLLRRMDDRQIAAFMRKAGGEEEAWRQMIADETWFTAEEAVAVGLVDELAPVRSDRANQQFDLSAFKSPPAAAAPESDKALVSALLNHEDARAAAMARLLVNKRI